MSATAVSIPQRGPSCPSTAERRGLAGGFRRRTELAACGPAEDRRLARAITCAKTGDQEAIRYLYCRFADNVYGYVRSIIRDDHEAEDVTQNVFVKLSTAIGKYQPREVPFSAWILRVARNAALDQLRQRRAVPVAEVHLADRPADEDHAHEAMGDALAALPVDQRDVVVLRHVLGLSPPEIAARTGRSEASIHGLHHRGRAALRRELTVLEATPSTLGRD